MNRYYKNNTIIENYNTKRPSFLTTNTGKLVLIFIFLFISILLSIIIRYTTK